MPSAPDGAGPLVPGPVLLLVAATVLLLVILGGGAPGRLAGRLVLGLVLLLLRALGALISLGIYALVVLVRGRTGSLPRAPGGESVLEPTDRHRLVPPTGDYRDYRGLAQPHDLSTLADGNLPLGRYVSPRGRRGRLLFLPSDHLHRGCVIVGPTGSGKTESLIVPWILALLRGRASVVTVDVKGDLYDRLAAEAKALGVRLWYWSSADPRSQSWNWLEEVRDERDVEAAVQSILGRRNPHDPQPFFYERDCRWLRAIIQVARIAHGSHPTPAELYQLLADRRRLERCFHDVPPVRRYEHEIADLMQFPPDEYSRAVSGLLNALHLFNTEDVRRISERQEFDLSQITQTPTLLIVGASLAEAGRSEVLSALLLNRVFNEVYRRFQQRPPGPAGRPGAAQRPVDGGPLFLIIDEAARLQDRIPYEEVLSVVRAAGVGICLAVQDVAQFGDEQRRSAILANCLTMILLRGCSPRTAEEFSKRLGQRQERFLAQTETKGFWDLLPSHRGTQVQVMTVPVLQVREIMHPPDTCGRFCAVVHVQQASPKPFLVDLTRG